MKRKRCNWKMLRRLCREVRLVVFDFDGVFTDNTVLVSDDGTESVRCWRSDGLGLQRLVRSGVEVRVLSTETNRVVSVRCRKLGITCEQGCQEKGAALKALLRRLKLSASQVAYVGNDVNDLPCLECVGLPIVVQDAHPSVVSAARYQTHLPGGRGAVREVCDLLVTMRSLEKLPHD